MIDPLWLGLAVVLVLFFSAGVFVGASTTWLIFQRT